MTEKKRQSGYIIRKKYEGQPVCLDPTVQAKENETGIHFTGGDRSAWISSYEPVVVEGLLQHKYFKIEQLVTLKIGREECVVGVVGKLPIGALQIGRRRPSDRHDLIVNLR
ncbi:hypothetical protein HY229_03025 [Candidatus Acetothermia bacterium]|nr:hypothetical protein [Candidatus Acetothermia bacterium]MBI3643056.1 hypothetical protein [Candidatus Acetothermia bacterium]